MKQPTHLAEWLSLLEQRHPVAWDLGLERVGRVAREMGILKPAATVFLVAGTNGKGSTCEYLSRLSQGLGHKVGKATSPHLQHFNERIEINGQLATDSAICRAFAAIENARGDTSLTYFEFGTLAALFLFCEAQVDVAVLEIGLGGRLDAMNIVTPSVSVITRVALDHQAWLGDDRETIGAEKAGIMRAQTPCVLADREPPESVLNAAKALSVPLLRVGEAFDVALDNGDTRLQYSAPQTCTIDNLGSLALPAISLATAVQAMVAADLLPTSAAVRQAAAAARLPGRLQWLAAPHATVLDVAHNPDAADYLVARLDEHRQHAGQGRCLGVLGMYADKDHGQVLGLLASRVDAWFLAEMDDPRAAPAADLAAVLTAVGEKPEDSPVSIYDTVAAAYQAALAVAGPADYVLVTGSFPAVAGVLDFLESQV